MPILVPTTESESHHAPGARMAAIQDHPHPRLSVRTKLIHEVVQRIVADILRPALLRGVVRDQRFVQPILFIAIRITLGLIGDLRSVPAEVEHDCAVPASAGKERTRWTNRENSSRIASPVAASLVRVTTFRSRKAIAFRQ